MADEMIGHKEMEDAIKSSSYPERLLGICKEWSVDPVALVEVGAMIGEVVADDLRGQPAMHMAKVAFISGFLVALDSLRVQRDA